MAIVATGSVIGGLVVVLILILLAGDGYYDSDSASRLTHAFGMLAISFGVLAVGLFFSWFTSRVGDIRRAIIHQKMRLSYVTPKDYSYGVIFSDNVLRALNGVNKDYASRLLSIVNVSFGHPEIIAADKAIRDASNKIEGREQAHKAKLLVVDKVESLLQDQGLLDAKHFNDLRNGANQAFANQLSLIKEKAKRKLGAIDALTSR